MAALGNYDDILVPNATHAGPIDSRFYRKDLPGLKSRGRKSRFLMNIKSQPVTGSVKESAPAPLPDCRGIALLCKESFYLFVNLLAFDSGLERLECALLSAQAGFPHAFLRLTGPSADYRSREIPKIPTVRIARKDVQDD